MISNGEHVLHRRRSMSHSPRGSVLIFALLLTAGLLMVSVSIANLVIPEVQSARALSDALNAYYAAESCVDHGLMQYVRQMQGKVKDIIDPNLTLTAVPSTCRIDLKDPVGNGDYFRAKGSFRKAIQSITIEGLDPTR